MRITKFSGKQSRNIKTMSTNKFFISQMFFAFKLKAQLPLLSGTLISVVITSLSWITCHSCIGCVHFHVLKKTRNFYFMCNLQKSPVNIFHMKIIEKHCHKRKWVSVFVTLLKKTFKSRSFCNISNFHNSYNRFVWNPSKVQGSLFERIARFLK